MRNSFKILIFIWLVYLPFSNHAQNEKDKIEALRVSFITKKVELSSSESEKFWPVYNEYNDKIKAIKKNLRQSFRKSPETLSDRDAEELYQLDVKSKQAEVDIHKLYSEKIKVIIGAKKFIKLRIAEEEFKREIINSIKDKSD